MNFETKKTPKIEVDKTAPIQPPTKHSWLEKFWKHQTAEEKNEIAQLKKQLDEEKELIRQEEKEKLYRDFDIDALFVEPEEPDWLAKYMPMITAVLAVIILIVVALK